MASKVFLDANIVLDFTLKRDMGHADAKALMEHVVNGSIQAYITSIVVHIAGCFLKKTHGIELTKKILLTFLMDIRTIDLPFLVVQQALKSNMPYVEGFIAILRRIASQYGLFYIKR